jgi:hypothetical protein
MGEDYEYRCKTVCPSKLQVRGIAWLELLRSLLREYSVRNAMRLRTRRLPGSAVSGSGQNRLNAGRVGTIGALRPSHHTNAYQEGGE